MFAKTSIAIPAGRRIWAGSFVPLQRRRVSFLSRGQDAGQKAPGRGTSHSKCLHCARMRLVWILRSCARGLPFDSVGVVTTPDPPPAPPQVTQPPPRTQDSVLSLLDPRSLTWCGSLGGHGGSSYGEFHHQERRCSAQRSG